jgi:uncharacterized membrane protein YkvA (DUF1232 family)
MTDSAADPRFLELFPQWLRSLGVDASAVAEAVAGGRVDDATRWLVGGLNYVFKALDLIPDGVEDIGFLDDAFVLRVACARAVARDPALAQGVVQRLADDAGAVAEFMGPEYARLEAYIAELPKGAARGRTVDEIMAQPQTRTDFVREVKAWSEDYHAPSFSRDAKNLVKLRAFLGAKLPR